MNTLTQDFRYGLRSLAKSPMFTGVALVSLALGIGANTAIFSLMDQVLLRLLPVKNPEQLVTFLDRGPHRGMIRGDDTFSYPMYQDLRDHNEAFSGIVADFDTDLNLSYKGSTERVNGLLVSGNYFDVLGVQAILGRTFTPADDKTRGGHPLVILSHGYWMRRFGGDRGILGQTIMLNAHPMTVVGVTQPGFSGIDSGSSRDVMVPVAMKAQMTPDWDDMGNRRSMWLQLVGRLKPGVTREQAEAAVAPLFHSLLEQELSQMTGTSPQFQKRFLGKKLQFGPGQKGRSELRKQFSTPLMVLMAMVGLVLLIACANVANLLIARAAARQKEMAIRVALGASRWRIIRQLLVESVALSVTGGMLGLLVAGWTGSALVQFLPFEGASLTLSPDPDLRALMFSLALSVMTGLLFGLAPAIQAVRPALAATLKDQASNTSAGAGHVRFRLALVVAQVALSLLLLIGAGLFASSLYNLKTLNPGFRTDHLMTFSVDPQLNGYQQPRVRDFYQRLQENIKGIPDVKSVSMAVVPLLSDQTAMMTVTVEGYHAKEGEDTHPVVNWIGPGYFSTLGIPMVGGRDFNEKDSAGSPKVAVVNEKMARYFFGNQNPVGRHFGFGAGPGVKMDVEIVGVVKDGKHGGLRETAPRFVYVPYQHQTIGRMTFYVQTGSDPRGVSGALRREVQKLDPNLPVFQVKSMQTQVDESIFVDRIIATLSCFFGLLATLLAAVGLYGVMAYTVARRTREIGVRIALGAENNDVLWLVMKEVALLIAIGVGIALPVSFGLGKLIQSQLFGVQASDPLILTSATLALSAVALLAGYLPAMRAARVDPLVALRYE